MDKDLIGNGYRNFMKNFALTNTQLQDTYRLFCAEVRKGLNKNTNAQSDIKCFVTYVQDFPTGEEHGNYLALDLGGTKFRVLLVTLKGSSEAVLDADEYVLTNEVITGTAETLFDYIAWCLFEFVNKRELRDVKLPLGFTFSFPCVQVGLGKATLTRWTKGFNSSGVIGQDVGRLLAEAIERRGDVSINVTAILNDTTGTLMSCAHRNPECRVGVIVGTGCNACYVEHVDNVDLLEDEYKENKKHVVINCEWGAFGDSGIIDFIRTEFDRTVDRKSINVGGQIFEKMLSGMYLGELVRLVMVKAITKNMLFTSRTDKKRIVNTLMRKRSKFDSYHITLVEADSVPEFRDTRIILKEFLEIDDILEVDCARIRYTCELISRRSATLVGLGISALINKMNKRKVVVGIDGSVYRYHTKYDAYIRQAMYKFVNPDIEFDIMLSEDGSGRGAALIAAVAIPGQKPE